MPITVQVHRIVKERKGHGEYIPPHTHPFYHCVYVISGSGYIRIGEQNVEASRGQFLRIAPNTEHAIYGENAMQSFDIKFSAQGDLLKAVNDLPVRMPLDLYEHTLVMSLFHLAIRGERYTEELINARMTELLLLLLRRGVREPEFGIFPSQANRACLHPALSYVENHPNEMPSVAFLAQLCGYTPSYFSTVFKELMGCSPAKYLAGQKIDLARELMLTTDDSVSQIAERLGLEPETFSRMFKKATGISPSIYLRRANSDVGINISPNSPFLPDGPFEIPKQPIP